MKRVFPYTPPGFMSVRDVVIALARQINPAADIDGWLVPRPVRHGDEVLYPDPFSHVRRVDFSDPRETGVPMEQVKGWTALCQARDALRVLLAENDIALLDV